MGTTMEMVCKCRTFVLNPTERAYLDGCDFVHTVNGCSDEKKVTAVIVSPVSVAHEFRVVWQREGKVQRIHRYATRKGAERRLAILTSDEPFKALGVEPDERVCCGGDMCGCGGLTYRERHEALKRDLPTLLYARIEQRTIGEWLSERKTDGL